MNCLRAKVYLVSTSKSKWFLNIFIYCFLSILSTCAYAQSNAFNISKEINFYSKLFDEYKKIDRLTTITNEVSSNAKLLRNVLADGVHEALDEHAKEEAGIAAGVVDDLYIQFEKFVDDYELPNLEDIPSAGNIPDLGTLSSKMQREIINLKLTELTNNATYYKTKLEDYEATTLFISGISNSHQKVKKENNYIAKSILDYMKQGWPIPWQTAWMFNVTYKKKIARIGRKINLKKSDWDESIENQKIRFENFKTNVSSLLLLEKKTLSDEYEKVKKKIEDYNEELNKLNKEVTRLEDFEEELPILEKNIDEMKSRITELNKLIKNYEGIVTNKKNILNHVQNWKNYKTKYNGCPNEAIYDQCTHDSEKLKFRKNRNKRIKQLKSDIKYNSAQISSKQRLVGTVKNNLQKKEYRLSFLKEEVKKLPQKKIDFEELSDEVKEYLERVDIFFTRKLLNENQRNLNKIHKL
ncbi:coiled-coil domain-containing protein [Maribacter dokdonensis]|uniref:coiled-coil domain-containing protein n=1 Tax=Maribacter dokdonensis TaxID=320912 RepID=UPI001C0922F7|nr:hypothetical protein [Maribacter dokdonensis]MBU2902616.1 hypothetical protein [Maribacter dokdonensis]